MSKNAELLCGVDVGGTKLAAALYTQEGEQITSVEVHDHRNLAADAFANRIIQLIREMLDSKQLTDKDILGIGIGFAGHIFFKKGEIITSSNFPHPFRNYPLRDRIQAAFTIPVVLDNDANAQAYGEYRFGAGKQKEDMVFLTVSSGIGAGIILGGRLIRGVTGTAGEVGHTIVNYDAEQQCTCGNQGCLMALSSGIFFPDLFLRKLKEGKKTALDICPENISLVTGTLVAAGLQQGDPICCEIAADSAKIVGIGIYNIFAMLNPQTVIVGGGLMNLSPQYMDMIRASFLSLVRNMMVDQLEILSAELGPNAGLMGAAALPLEQQR